jgi:hypothetical protein
MRLINEKGPDAIYVQNGLYHSILFTYKYQAFIKSMKQNVVIWTSLLIAIKTKLSFHNIFIYI